MSVTGPAEARRKRPRVSVIISCFNYGRYVREAIESALAQGGAPTEVIVVDDGSQDASAEQIAQFGERVVAIFKPNGGQASALNAGFAASRGRSLIFLDADDVLLPGAAGAVDAALAGEVAKAHWPMPVIDQDGRRTGEVRDVELAEGDLRAHALRDGPLSDMTMPSAAMSGNAFPRWLLERIMPIPEELYRIFADEYLFGLAPSFGPIVRLSEQSLYRLHERNAHSHRPFEEMLAFQRRHCATVAAVVREACRRAGRSHDEREWQRSAWWLRTARVVEAIEAHVPPGQALALIDQASLGIGRELRGRAVVAFPADDQGEFAGVPADDQAALCELKRLREAGVRYLALAWPARWWLQEYPRMAGALRDGHRLLAQDEDVLLFQAR